MKTADLVPLTVVYDYCTEDPSRSYAYHQPTVVLTTALYERTPSWQARTDGSLPEYRRASRPDARPGRHFGVPVLRWTTDPGTTASKVLLDTAQHADRILTDGVSSPNIVLALANPRFIRGTWTEHLERERFRRAAAVKQARLDAERSAGRLAEEARVDALVRDALSGVPSPLADRVRQCLHRGTQVTLPKELLVSLLTHQLTS